MVAGTVCSVVLGTVVTLIISEIFSPDTDTSGAARQVADIINTLIGLMAGFLAGRTDYTIQQQKKRGEEETKDETTP
jgi:hypothetical protein